MDADDDYERDSNEYVEMDAHILFSDYELLLILPLRMDSDRSWTNHKKCCILIKNDMSVSLTKYPFRKRTFNPVDFTLAENNWTLHIRRESNQHSTHIFLNHYFE